MSHKSSLLRETTVSLKEVARRLDVHVKTVRNWRKRKKGKRLETEKYGGKVVTSWEAVERFREVLPSTQPAEIRPGIQKRHEAALKRLEEVHGI